MHMLLELILTIAVQDKLEDISAESRSTEICVKCLYFCGRQGIALQGHMDNETSSSFNKGVLLALRVDAGDKVLEHQDLCMKCNL